MAAICKKCLVELDVDMQVCPLCGTPVSGEAEMEAAPKVAGSAMVSEMEASERRLVQRILWQVTATLLLSGILATLIIDLSRTKSITWSLYPVVICLMLLSYVCVFAFWQAKTMYRVVAGWLLSTLLLVLINLVFPDVRWTVGLGIPLVFVVNFTALALLTVFRITKRKGLNLLAYTFVAIAVLCLSIEAIISRYFEGVIELGWSIIVAVCLLPVSAALIFVFFRTWNNPKLQKFFHT